MTSPEPAQSSHRKWWVCGLLLCATTINYMDRQTLANAATRVTREFGLSNEQYGNIETGFGWAFAAGSLLFGFVADRVSIRWLYPAVLAAWSLVGLLTGLIHTYEGLLGCRTLLGLFEAGHWPCALKTTQYLLTSKDRAMGNSVLQSGASIGAIITPTIMALMLTERAGSWRLPFIVIGATGLVWIFFWLALVRDADLRDPNPPANSPGDGQRATPGLWQIISDRRFLALLCVVSLINTSWQLLRAWLPKILIEGRGYAETQALYFNSLYYIATDVGCLGAGALTLWLVKRGLTVHRARARTFLCCALLTALTTVVAALPRGGLLLAVLLLVGAGSLGLFPCYYAFSQELSVAHMGKITGLLGFSAWATSAPMHTVFGRLVDQTGSFDLGLAVVGCLPLVGFACLRWLWQEPREIPNGPMSNDQPSPNSK